MWIKTQIHAGLHESTNTSALYANAKRRASDTSFWCFSQHFFSCLFFKLAGKYEASEHQRHKNGEQTRINGKFNLKLEYAA
ncbi:hypothetical protein [Formosimonas limnophila]|uniref:hypothetical protein n=1 Tax=Formosimonas limnophila TaxID=1384487 RepID=UPI001E612202|nr:hypothetical protein [Formosimonas limnophila]